tara:strand:- start:1492 stop:1857 length:366 start_codon:yes stop_codon:yes gene_type:complete
MKFKELFKLTWLPVAFASLCCLAPVILVLLGLSTVAFAASLSDFLYGDLKWLFRLGGLVLLAGSTFFYLRRQKGICTIDEFKKKRKKVLNTILIVLIVGVLGYIFFLYVVVEIIGELLGIW